ncbi:MAG: hypothetical protein Q4G04_02575 [bacterium]|nr:hypothetical protein [bacterium]
MLIIEGIDGVGKTTLVELFQKDGMKKFHFDYDAKNMDLFSKYLKILSLDGLNDLALDRSFVSEMVYGPVVRNKCKLSLEQYIELLRQYSLCGAYIIYLIAPKEALLARRKDDPNDLRIIEEYYDQLSLQYDRIMQLSSNYIEVLQFDTFKNDENQIQKQVRKLIKK